MKIAIKGKILNMMLPAQWGLVLEGGGTRGSYTAGVLDAFLQADLMFPYTIGVSAGSATSISYLSGQKDRNKYMFQYYVTHKNYMGMSHLIKEKSYINRDYVFRTLPQEELYFDWNTFYRNQARLQIGAFHCEKGEMIWFEKEAMDETLLPLMASTAMPFISPMVDIDGDPLLDGGILSPIPIEKSITDGNQFHVIVLTQNKGYRKKEKNQRIAKKFYGGYEEIVDALSTRHINYNRQLELCEELERQGKAMILRPQEKMEITRLERNPKKIMGLYQQGYEDGLVGAEKLRWRLAWEEKCV